MENNYKKTKTTTKRCRLRLINNKEINICKLQNFRSDNYNNYKEIQTNHKESQNICKATQSCIQGKYPRKNCRQKQNTTKHKRTRKRCKTASKRHKMTRSDTANAPCLSLSVWV